MGHCLWGTVSLSCLAPSLPCLHASACSICKRPGLCPGKGRRISSLQSSLFHLHVPKNAPEMLSGGSSGEMHADAFHQALEGLFRPCWVLWATRICFLLPPTSLLCLPPHNQRVSPLPTFVLPSPPALRALCTTRRTQRLGSQSHREALG